MSKYFGTDGIRGEFGKVVTTSFAEKVGLALGIFGCGTLVVGMDTRESSLELKEALIKGAKASGIFVYDLNVITTPALMYISSYYHTLAVMITASHNPYTDNGIKVINNGVKLNDEEINLLEKAIGYTTRVKGIELPYLSIFPYLFLARSFKIKNDLTVVFDLANGAGCFIIKEILHYYSFKTIFINDKPNGKNINDNCGSLYLDNLIETVKKEKADFGFAFDGDADRLMAIDSSGKVFDGDYLIYLFSNYLKEKNQLTESKVALSLDVNPGVIESYKKCGIEVELADVGDRNIHELMIKDQISIGGETSGHIINLRLSPTGDGLLNVLFLLFIVTIKNKSLVELTSDLNLYPILRENVANFSDEVIQSPKLSQLIQALKASISSPYSLILVRRSGTEHLVRISVSTGNSKRDTEYMNVILKTIGGEK